MKKIKILKNLPQNYYEIILNQREKDKANTYKFDINQFIGIEVDEEFAGVARIYVDEYDNVDIGGLYIFPKFRNYKFGYKLFEYLINNTSYKNYFLDCDLGLQNYYEEFGFEKLKKPENFQIEKIKGIYKMYNLDYSEKILDNILFMKFEKK